MASRWMNRLMEAISGCWEWHALALHVGFQYRKPQGEDDCWEVWAFPAVQEIVGGQHDGERGWSGFNFDLSRFLGQFEAEHISVSTARPHDPAEVTLEGRFRGKAVVLHLCFQPPEDAEPTEVIDLTGPGGASVREKD
jgi:hypothetical protein